MPLAIECPEEPDEFIAEQGHTVGILGEQLPQFFERAIVHVVTLRRRWLLVEFRRCLAGQLGQLRIAPTLLGRVFELLGGRLLLGRGDKGLLLPIGHGLLMPLESLCYQTANRTTDFLDGWRLQPTRGTHGRPP